ncbi:MAG: hypothetical protein ACO36I_19585 [Candidatus Latescibacterota bacterium]
MSSVADCEKFLAYGDKEWDRVTADLVDGAPITQEQVEIACWLTGKTIRELEEEEFFYHPHILKTEINKHRYRDAY